LSFGYKRAGYGKILANVAATIMNKPASRLVGALQTNGDSLMRLTSDFKFQLPNYHVVIFYEMKLMEGFSKLVGLASKRCCLLQLQ
jgi:hypothetical protein